MAEQSEQYEKFFSDADSDNDGKLTLSELTSALRQHGYTGSDEDIKGFFNDIDFTGDRKITREEYMLYMRQKPVEYHKSAVLRQAFEHFDKDKSGEIDKAELQAVFAECGHVINEKETERLMSEVDKDGSGTLNYEEFISALF